tara:strand:+ start:220 stop:1896 length:1677 start_codon:yes stop_codon:yes gene_type:complete
MNARATHFERHRIRPLATMMLLAVAMTGSALAGPASANLESIARLLRGDVRMVVLGDSYSSNWFFRVPLAFMRSWPIPRITALTGGAKQYQDFMRCIALCEPVETIGPGDDFGFQILRQEPQETYFTLPVCSTREIRLSSELTFTSVPDRMLEFRVNNHRFEPGVHGRFSASLDRLRFRMLYRAPEDPALLLPGLQLLDYAGRSTDFDLRSGARGMLNRNDDLDAGHPAVAGQVNATWPDIDVHPDFYARVRAHVDNDLIGTDTYLNPVGSLYYHVDQSGERIPGFYYSYLADSSWSYEGFCSDIAPTGPLDKRFPRSQFVHWLDATTIDPAQPVLFTWYFAPEVSPYEELKSTFERLVQECDLIGEQIGLQDVRHLIVIPHMYKFTGGLGDNPAAHLVMQDHVQAAFELAGERSNVAAVSIYTATDGVLFDGSDESKAWLLEHGFDEFEYGTLTADLVDEPQSGDLLDASDIHPLDEASAAFFATIVGDAIRRAGCPADLRPDGTIDVLDMLAIFERWGQSSHADVDGSGVFDVGDLLAVLDAWGDCWPVQAPFDRR